MTPIQSFHLHMARSTSPLKCCVECGALLPKATELCAECGEEFAAYTRGKDLTGFDDETEARLGPYSLDAFQVAIWQKLCEAVERGGKHSAWADRMYGELFGVPPSERVRQIALVAAQEDSQVERRAFYREQLRIAQERGYKLGWASYRYKDRYGEWPPQELRAA
jgi:ribosomal protein L40E